MGNNRISRRKNGTITLKALEYQLGKSKLLFRLGAADFITKQELYLKLDVMNENKQFMPIYVTEPQKNNHQKQLEWKPFYLNANKITEETQTVRFEIFEKKKGKPPKSLGEVEIIYSFLKHNNGKTLKIYKNNLTVGEIKLIEVKEASKFTFLNYIYSGWEIKLICGIDLTASNRDAKDLQSLHHVRTLEGSNLAQGDQVNSA